MEIYPSLLQIQALRLLKELKISHRKQPRPLADPSISCGLHRSHIGTISSSVEWISFSVFSWISLVIFPICGSLLPAALISNGARWRMYSTHQWKPGNKNVGKGDTWRIRRSVWGTPNLYIWRICHWFFETPTLCIWGIDHWCSGTPNRDTWCFPMV